MSSLITSDLPISDDSMSSACVADTSPKAAHRLDVFQREPSREHAQPRQQRPLRRRQQIVAPLDRGAQRLVAWQRSPAAAVSRPKSVSLRRSWICSGPRIRVLTAASSIARGSPSSRRHRPTTAAWLAAVSSKLT